ncbi:3371_t:CDS:2, partial [Gigaspora rosea]
MQHKSVDLDSDLRLKINNEVSTNNVKNNAFASKKTHCQLIRQADNNTTDITPTWILTGNLIKTYFGTEYLANIHASLNNTYHLRYYVDKIQKELHPQGQGLLGVVYNYSCNLNNIR